MTDEEERLKAQIRAEERAKHPDWPHAEIEKSVSVFFSIATMPRVVDVEYEPAPSLTLEEAVRRINLKLAKFDGRNEQWPRELVKAENETQETWHGKYRLEEWTPDPPDDDDSPKFKSPRPDQIYSTT